MFPYPDTATLNPVLRAQLDAQAALLSSLAQHSVELFARMSELHLQLARQSLDTTLDAGHQLLACTDPSQLATTALHGWQPLGEHMRTYLERLMGVLADTQSHAKTDLGKATAQSPLAAMFAAATDPQAAAGAPSRPH